ncbi:hypothetical protein [Roseicyclus persicicus]|uniref:Uncharacterized protein n=1 Tax=Roseicyclus persicicus TaxID=2650661 RepID=A0A7X6GXQ1_9RHOB|nr:hypothetical protein [Roseibacterium persicicum]NKX44330.1 hypothetical protein [Roseibacterium persicicum]
MRVVLGAILMVLWALPALAQEAGRMTVETGGETHGFVATGVWSEVYGYAAPALQIEVDAEHPDGTVVYLRFVAVEGQVSDILFRFREPDTAEVYGREWTEAPGFRVTLAELRREGDTVAVSGAFRGPILDPNAPDGRARIRGSFAVTLVEPIWPSR